MINTQDQEQLFTLIANYIDKDIICTAIGGTAMMFSGYKNATKDIDLVFDSDADRKIFIKAIEQLGYKEKSLTMVYDHKRKSHANKPKMYSRGEERFDLFVKTVFGFIMDTQLEQRQEFIGKKDMIVNIPSPELLILLKAITRREKDHEDILTIIQKESIDWGVIVTLAIKQKKNNEWILLDLEETMQQLKKVTFIKKKFFDQIYAYQ
ncbi:MAG: hypothetical protein KKG59_05240 [Nanoarchaeota archaeon]|nr:hypothetical protein [Nanoarchaeota archaeon]